jgi:S1-C subfamily serine protease
MTLLYRAIRWARSIVLSVSVVTIKATSRGAVTGGSRFIVDASGTIVTNLHVIHGATAIAVKLSNGDIYDEDLIRVLDQRKDLAVVVAETRSRRTRNCT